MSYKLGVIIVLLLVLIMVLRKNKAKLVTSTNLLISDNVNDDLAVNMPVWDSAMKAFKTKQGDGKVFYGSRLVYSYGLWKPGESHTVTVQDNSFFGSGLFVAQFAGEMIMWWGYYGGTAKMGRSYVIFANDAGRDIDGGLGSLRLNMGYPNSLTATYKNTGGTFSVYKLVGVM